MYQAQQPPLTEKLLSHVPYPAPEVLKVRLVAKKKETVTCNGLPGSWLAHVFFIQREHLTHQEQLVATRSTPERCWCVSTHREATQWRGARLHLTAYQNHNQRRRWCRLSCNNLQVLHTCSFVHNQHRASILQIISKMQWRRTKKILPSSSRKNTVRK